MAEVSETHNVVDRSKMLRLLVSILFVTTLTVSVDFDTITPADSLRDGDALVSTGNVFQLGFFSPEETVSGGSRRYLGVWYKQLLPRAIVWVANRETPLLDRSGVLNMSSDGDLRLVDGKNRVIWSANASRRGGNPVLQLIPAGNLIVRDGLLGDIDKLLWQSIDFPDNTLIAGMMLGKNLVTKKEWSLSSWKSPEDPSAGEFSLFMDTRGFPQLMMKKGSKIRYRVGPWNGLSFSGTPEFRQANNIFKYAFELNDEQVTFSWDPIPKVVSIIVLNSSGFIERFVHPTKEGWLHVYAVPRDRCDQFSVCGPFGICSMSTFPDICSCFKGFVPKSPGEWNMSRWAGGCVPEIELHCSKGDNFVKMENLKLPDTSGSWYDKGTSVGDCKKMCLNNCSCTAYANMNIQNGGSGCVLWFSPLMDTRAFSSGGQDVYVRIANPNSGSSRIGAMKIGIIVVSVTLFSVTLAAYIFCIRKKNMKRNLGNIWKREYGDEEKMELPIFEVSTIAKATDDFSDINILGEGGFGPVYKGKFEEGQEIAVKRLSATSGQGIEEFKNEVKLIAKLQHRNLVKLLGCCINGDHEQMLIYEYMPNKSLDYFIFDEKRSKALKWSRRMNIIMGIARGLLYLHQDSRLRIIHRDLKAANVLLDLDMNPKISDFGLAKSFGGDQVEANTNKVVGTYGYMSPEYAVDGHFSVKSDVFSFGVLVLEVVTGKKNRGFRHSGHDLNLLGHAWKLWLEGRAMELTDEVFLGETCAISEVMRCIHVGLLCVQQRPEDRPNMASVVLMLSGDGSLTQPKQPGFFTGRNVPEVSSSSSLLSVNEVSFTMLDGR